MEDEIKIPEVRTKMRCPVMNTCTKKPSWFKPLFMNGKEVNKKDTPHGHCIPHYENSHCAETGKTCPVCVPFNKIKEII